MKKILDRTRLTNSISLVAILSVVCSCTFNIAAAEALPSMTAQSSSAEAKVLYKHSTGLSFYYPSALKIKKAPDKDTIVKVAGKLPSKGEMEISVSISDNRIGLSIPTFEKILHDAMFSKLQNLKKSQLVKQYVGKSGRIEGYLERLKFTIHDAPYTQDYFFIPARGKIITFVLTTSQMQRSSVEIIWQRCLNSIQAPQNLIALTPVSKTVQTKKIPYCDAYSSQCANVRKPRRSATLNQKVAAVLPRKKEELFLEIPWQPNILLARQKAIQLKKPIFVWIMDGNVLGAT